MRLLLLSSDLSGNALGRAQSLWLIARELGWDVRVAGPLRQELWPPVRDSAFADICQPLPISGRRPFLPDDLCRWSDATVAVKAMPESFGLAVRAQTSLRGPLLLDIDDPDLDEVQRIAPLRAKCGLVHPRRIRSGYHPWQLKLLERKTRSVPILTSNPSLRLRHGGYLIPHVREAVPPGRAHVRERPVVAFVGTPRIHKGIEVLRSAVSRLSYKGLLLVLTSQAPSDAAPWERWVGETNLADGRSLLDEADIVALPSLDMPFAREQLPVKVIDAMLSARAIVASELPPLRWALASTGLYTRPGSVEDLVGALQSLMLPARRVALAKAARHRALGMFTPTVVAPRLLRAIEFAKEESSSSHAQARLAPRQGIGMSRGSARAKQGGAPSDLDDAAVQ
jgi:glycosyltransferase involved in cell wall biosynthesis